MNENMLKRGSFLGHIFFLMVLGGFSFSGQTEDFELKQRTIQEKRAVVATIQLKKGDPKLELFWKKDDGTPLKTFESLNSWLKSRKRSLLFAANSGTYRDTPSLAPIGLHIENGRQLTKMNFANNCGNFCWYSGVFLIDKDQARIFPREDAAHRNLTGARLALQSGPLFVRSGNLQGTWSSTSYNLNRSAICTTNTPGQILLVLVIEPTNFVEFFRVVKELGCQDALFLDGNVSSFYDGKSRSTLGNPFELYAGIIAVTAPLNSK